MALTIGLHWIVLQSVAWAGMFVDYSAEYSWAVAFDKTFDAENKCQICRFVEEGTQSASESEQPVKLNKLEVFRPSVSATAFATPELDFALLEPTAPLSLATSPPTPPPPVS